MSQSEKDLVDRVSAMLLDELTEGGRRALRAMRVDALEDEVFGLADRVSRRVAGSMLEEQADELRRETRCWWKRRRGIGVLPRLGARGSSATGCRRTGGCTGSVFRSTRRGSIYGNSAATT
jgi:hypothetical protein